MPLPPLHADLALRPPHIRSLFVARTLDREQNRFISRGTVNTRPTLKLEVSVSKSMAHLSRGKRDKLNDSEKFQTQGRGYLDGSH